MAGINRYKGTGRNFTATRTFPTTATAATVTGLHGVKFDAGISAKKEAADGDLFPTVHFNDYQDPSLSMEGIDPYSVSAFTPDQRFTLAFQIADAYGGLTAAAGGKSYSITNSFLVGVNIDHVYREYGKNSVSWGTISADGTTSPVTVAAL